MLGSNRRPLPREGSMIVFSRFLELPYLSFVALADISGESLGLLNDCCTDTVLGVVESPGGKCHDKCGS